MGWTHHVKSNERIQLNQAVKVAKDNGHGHKDNVAGVAQQQAHELDKLGEAKHEDELGPKGIVSILDVPLGRRPPARGKQKRVDDKGERGEGRKVEGVGAPGLLSVETKSLVRGHALALFAKKTTIRRATWGLTSTRAAP